MAVLYVTEFSEVPSVRNVPTPLAVEPAVAEQAVTFTTTTQSAAFNADTRYVRIYASADCHIRFGTNPTATTSTAKMKADVPEWRAVTQGHKVAAVTAS
jgi:hypothetical protein